MTMIKVLVVLLVVKTAYSQTIVPLSLCETKEVNVRENSEGVIQHVQNTASGNCTLILNILGNSGHVYLQGIMDYTKASPCGKTKQLNINDKLYCVINTEPSKEHKIIVTQRMMITAEKSNPSFTINYNTQGNFNYNFNSV